MERTSLWSTRCAEGLIMKTYHAFRQHGEFFQHEPVSSLKNCHGQSARPSQTKESAPASRERFLWFLGLHNGRV